MWVTPGDIIIAHVVSCRLRLFPKMIILIGILKEVSLKCSKVINMMLDYVDYYIMTQDFHLSFI